MNYRLQLVTATVVLCAGSATLWKFHHSQHPEPARHSAQAVPPHKTSAMAKKAMAAMPLWFEALPDGRFASKSMGRTVVLDQQAAVWNMRGGSTIAMEFRNGNKAPAKRGVDRMKARFDRYK